MAKPSPRLILVGAVALLVAYVLSERAGCEIGPRRSAEPLGASAEEPLRVYAAASLADFAAEMGARWSGAPLRFNFAGSNVLAQQIAAGAPADVFLSADLRQIERLEASGHAPRGARVPILANELVVIAPTTDRPTLLATTADLGRFATVAVADPEGAPAGVYAARWLRAAGVWDAVRSRLIPTLDVRAALAAVASGNADAGIVYRTDALGEDRVQVIHAAGPGEAPEIVYYGVALGGSRAAELLAYLRGREVQPLIEAHGFRVPGGSASAPPARPEHRRLADPQRADGVATP